MHVQPSILYPLGTTLYTHKLNRVMKAECAQIETASLACPAAEEMNGKATNRITSEATFSLAPEEGVWKALDRMGELFWQHKVWQPQSCIYHKILSWCIPLGFAQINLKRAERATYNSTNIVRKQEWPGNVTTKHWLLYHPSVFQISYTRKDIRSCK